MTTVPFQPNIYERLLGLARKPWSTRWLDVRLKAKQADNEARSKAGTDKVPNTTPSHFLADYAGEYVHPTYGILKIEMEDSELLFKLGKIHLPLTHFQYKRFDTPDDERYGKWSVNFLTNPQGDANKVVMSIDEAEVTFIRQASVPDSQLLTLLAGTYKTPTEAKLQVVLKEDNFLYL